MKKNIIHKNIQKNEKEEWEGIQISSDQSDEQPVSRLICSSGNSKNNLNDLYKLINNSCSNKKILKKNKIDSNSINGKLKLDDNATTYVSSNFNQNFDESRDRCQSAELPVSSLHRVPSHNSNINNINDILERHQYVNTNSYSKNKFISTIENIDFLGNFNELKLLNYFGNDLSILNSINHNNNKEFDKYYDKNILKNHIINNNFTPFKLPQIEFEFNIPIYLKLQFFNKCNNDNYYDIKFIKNKPNIYLPKHLYKKKHNNSSINESINNNDKCLKLIKKHYNDSIKLYEYLIENNVSEEQAIMVMPLATYTKFNKIDSLYKFYEIYKIYNNDFENIELKNIVINISKILNKLYPYSWNLLIDQ